MVKIRIKEKSLLRRKRDNYARKQKQRKLINYLRRELLSCTTHGLPHIVNIKIHWFERLFWGANFLLCSAVIVIVLAELYWRFDESPSVMSVEMDYFNWNVSFPAITLCPIRTVDNNGLVTLKNNTEAKTEEYLKSYLWSISLENLEQVDLQSLENVPFISPRELSEIAAAGFKRFDKNFLNINKQTSKDWTVSVEATMTDNGMCHVINSNVAVFQNPIKWRNKSLTYTKTNIELSAHDRDFNVEILNYDTNYKIYIHSPDEVIYATSSSYFLNQEGFLSFGLRVWSTRISDELRPNSVRIRRCRFVDEPMSERYPVYSYSVCIIECRIKMITKLCNCVPHFYKPLETDNICNFKDLACVIKYHKEILSLSTSEETLSQFSDTKGLPRSSKDCACVQPCEFDLYLKERETFVPLSSTNKVTVGVTTFPKVRVVRDIIFSFYDIFLRSAGAVNSCIGTSIISIMELLIILMRTPIHRLVNTIHVYWNHFTKRCTKG